MSYKREMEKAIKGYLAPFGFKYKAQYCSYVRMLNEDIEQSRSYADETHNRNHYFFLRVSATVSSMSLNEILYEITDGKIDFRDFVSTPAYLNTLDGMDVIHTEFIGERPMSENIESFANMFQYDIQTVFDKFKTQKEIYLSPIREKYFNPYNRVDVWYYVPLAYYFNGEFDKAFAFIDERVRIAYELIERFGKSETDLKTLNIYEAYRKNLKNWIAKKHTFKVDDEYLPRF